MTNKQIAEAFSKHDFEATYPFIAENITWNVIGGELMLDKQKVMAACEQSSAYLKTATTNFSKFLVLDNQDYVVVDSVADYTGKDNNVSKVASCDIYKFSEGQLTEITSYCIELNKQR